MRRRCALGFVVLIMGLAAVLLTACGGTTEAETAPTAEPTVAVVASPTPEATVAPTAEPTVALPTSLPQSSEDETDEELFALGERIFKEEAAEGLGCQLCHGADGWGDIGPNIRGKTPGDIQFALESIDAMSFLNLGQKKVEAVSLYLQWLATQP